MEKYYVIHNGEGDTTVYEYTKKELLEILNDDEEDNLEYFNEIPYETDTNYWGEGALIIRGEIVKPEEKKVVLNFDID
jgi:hypothetical protein